MPKVTIDLSQRTLNRIMDEVDRSNAASGTALDLIPWMELHFRELAISRDLSEKLQEIRPKHEADAEKRFRDSIHRERNRLLKLLEDQD